MPGPTYTGREYGKSFEKVFEKIGRLNGLLVMKNHLAGMPIGGGGVRIIKSELDYKIIEQRRPGHPCARVAYVDCKTFAGDHFTYSDLLSKKEPQDHQIQRAVLYNDWGLSAGFVVWFRSSDEVAFFPGRLVHERGPGARFGAGDGTGLGKLGGFDLRPIFDWP